MARRLNKRLLVSVVVFVGIPAAILVFGFLSNWFSSGDPKQHFEEAQRLAEAGEWAPAWTAIGNALRAGGSRNPAVQMLRAEIALHQRPPALPVVVQAYRAALSLDPKHVEAQRKLAELYLILSLKRYSTWKEARTETARLIEMDPDFGRGYLWAAKVEMADAAAEPLASRKVPFYEAALARCKAGIEKAPDLLELYLDMAEAYEALRQSDKAEEAMDLAIANNPAKPEAYIARAGRFVNRGQMDKATEVLKAGLARISDNPKILIALGEVGIKKRDPEMAREYFTKAIAADPKYENGYIRLAGMHRLDTEREKALAVLEEGLKQVPESALLRSEQADVYLELGQIAKADELIGQIEKRLPAEAPVVNFLRGKKAFLSRQVRVAISYLERAREAQPNPQTRLLLARAYLLADELGAARRELEALVGEMPTLVAAWRALAETQLRLHDFDRAGRSARMVLDADPDDTPIRLLLAQTLAMQQKPQDALREAQAAADRDKTSPDPYLLMADIYQDLKRLPDAERMYKKAVDAGKDLGRVYQRLVNYLRQTNQQDKLTRFLEEAKKVLTPDEYLSLAGTAEEVERELKSRVEKPDASAADFLNLGRFCQMANRLEDAEKLLAQALAKAERGAGEWRQAWQQLFLLHLATDQYAKAADLVAQMKTVDAQAPELLFADSLLALSQDRLDEAVQQLRTVLETHRTLSQGQFLLGQVLARQRKWEESVATLGRALEIRPNLIPARLLLGRIYLAQGNHAGALTEAVEALKYNAQQVAALELKAMAHAGLGAWRDAAAAREDIARLVLDNVENLIALAALHIQEHAPEKAEEVFRRAYEKQPDNGLLVRGFADFYIETGRAKQGEVIVDQYLEKHKDRASAYIVRGEFTAKAHGPAEADKYYRKAAELDPKDPYPVVFLGDQYARLAEWDKAAACYQEAAARAKDDPAPRKRLADIYMLQGKLDEAKAIIDQVLAAAPKDAPALVVAGRIADRQGRTAQAKEYIESALRLDAGYGEASVRLAELYAGPDPLRALEILAAVDPSDPAFEKAMLLRSDVNTRRVLLTDAILDLRRLLDFRPTSIPGRLTLAAKYMAVQKPREASDILAQLSRERMDQDPGLLANLGDSLMLQNRFPEALASYEKARALRPEFAEALVGEARALVAMNRTPEALQRVYDTANRFTKEVWPRMALVAIYEKTGELDKAFDTLRTALLYRPDWEQGYVYLADLLARAKRLDDARQVLLAGLAQAARSVPIRAGLAAIEISSGRSPDAAKILQPVAAEFESLHAQGPEKLDKLRPYLPPIRIYSLALYNLGRVDEALKWGMMLWAIDPTDIANANNMAWILATEKKESDRAWEMIQRCMRLVPNHPQVLDTAGWIAHLRGRADEATDYLLGSIKYGDNAEARYHLGRVYEDRQRHDEARAEYEKALQMGLGDKDKSEAERRLKALGGPAK